jgi:hypothetical protein
MARETTGQSHARLLLRRDDHARPDGAAAAALFGRVQAAGISGPATEARRSRAKRSSVTVAAAA